MSVKITVGRPNEQEEIGIGEVVVWSSEKYGLRVGKVKKITVTEEYGGRERVSVTVRPEPKTALPGSYYRTKPTVLSKLSRIRTAKSLLPTAQ